MSEMLSKHCPCCGEPIMAGQEECLNCRVYLLEVKKMATEKYSVNPELLSKCLADLGVRSIAELMRKLKEDNDGK